MIQSSIWLYATCALIVVLWAACVYGLAKDDITCGRQPFKLVRRLHERWLFWRYVTHERHLRDIEVSRHREKK